jgi:hypothetical protein
VSGAPPIVFYGSSGYALTIRDATPALWMPGELARVVAYIDDFRGDRAEAHDGAPIISFETWRTTLMGAPVLITVGDPRARRMLAERISAAGGPLRPSAALPRQLLVMLLSGKAPY